MANKKLYQAIYDKSYYELSPNTHISENLCWFVRHFFHPECSPLSELLGNYSLAIRGNTYTRDDSGKIVLAEATDMNSEDVMAMLFGLQYNHGEMDFEKDPYAGMFFSSKALMTEIASRWKKGAVIWCEKAGYEATPLVDYIKSATNPSIFVGSRQEIIIVSDETDRPGDIIIRMYPHF